MTARIVIHRGGGFTDIFRAYRIYVDGEKVGVLKRNSIMALNVQPGARQIGAGIDWCKAKDLTVTAVRGETLNVRVFNTYGPLKGMVAISTNSDTYLTLEEFTA